MSRKGNCWDNAVAESCFHTLKTAFISLEDLDTHAQAQTEVFAYIAVFYNRQRCHAANGYLAPLAYEQALKTNEILCPEEYSHITQLEGLVSRQPGRNARVGLSTSETGASGRTRSPEPSREDIGTVAVNQVSEGVTLGFRSLEVSPLDDSGFRDLHPLAGVRELGEGGRKGRCALAPYLGTVAGLAVLAWTLDDSRHVPVSLGVRVTLGLAW